MKILTINNAKFKKMINTIKNWFAQHLNVEVNNLKCRTNCDKFIFLVSHFDDTYKVYFENKSKIFIKAIILWIIRQFLYNQRRRRHRKNTRFFSKDIDIDDNQKMNIIFQSRVSFVISRQCVDENFTLKAQYEVDEFVIFSCTMRNILTNEMFDVKINIIQRIFSTKWRDILSEDMNISFDFQIYYQRDDKTMKIKINRHLKTTLFDVQFRKKINVSFRITLNVTISNNLYIYVTKENNLLIHRLNSMNKDLHVFKRDENVDTINDITSEDENISARKKRKYNDSHKNVTASTSSNVNNSSHKDRFFTHDSWFIESI
jgi:hypothetical protein